MTTKSLTLAKCAPAEIARENSGQNGVTTQNEVAGQLLLAGKVGNEPRRIVRTVEKIVGFDQRGVVSAEREGAEQRFRGELRCQRRWR